MSAVDSVGRTIFVANVHRDDGERFIVHAAEKLTAFLELESAIRGCGELVFDKGGRSLEPSAQTKLDWPMASSSR